MKTPKAKSRVVNSFNLSWLTGVKDVSFGKATIEGREGNDFKKGGTQVSKPKHDDEVARQERWGFPL